LVQAVMAAYGDSIVWFTAPASAASCRFWKPRWRRSTGSQDESVRNFIVGQACARVMTAAGRGAIVNIGSVSGLRGNAGRAAYGASKAPSSR